MALTRDYLVKRIQDLQQQHAAKLAEANSARALAHAISGAVQDATHLLAVMDGIVDPEAKPDAMAGLATDVTMEAEVTKGKQPN